MSDEQEIAVQEPATVEETPVISSEELKDTLTKEDTPVEKEETANVDLLGMNEDMNEEPVDENQNGPEEEVQVEETVNENDAKDVDLLGIENDSDAIEESNAATKVDTQEEQLEEEAVDEISPVTEVDLLGEETENGNQADDTPTEEVAVDEVESEPVIEDKAVEEEESPMEDVAIEAEETEPSNEEAVEETPMKDVPIEEAVEETPMEDVPIEEESQPTPENEEAVVVEKETPMENVPIEETEAAVEETPMEDVPIEQEVEDEAPEPVPEAPVDIIGDECAQEPVEEEVIPSVESKDLEEALEETEQDAKLDAEAEELAQAVDRSINIDPAVVASAGVATVAVGAVAASSAATEEQQEEAPAAAQESNLIRPIVIAGPSGAGKGTLIEGLMKRFPNDQFGFSVSHTTRKPREGEVNGVHYNFTSVESIKAEIDAGKFIEYAEVHGNYYGTSVDAVKSVQEQGKVCILDIDVQGVRNVKKSSLKPYYIFIAPPSMEDLEARLRGRGTEKEEDIQKRLANAAGEIKFGKEPGNFDKYLVNGNLAFAANDLASYVKEWYPHLKEVAVDPKESNFVQDCVTTATETCIIS